MEVKRLCSWCQATNEGEDPHCSQGCAYDLHTADQLLSYLRDLLSFSRNRLEDLTILSLFLLTSKEDDAVASIGTNSSLSDGMAALLEVFEGQHGLTQLTQQKTDLSRKISELERDLDNVQARLS